MKSSDIDRLARICGPWVEVLFRPRDGSVAFATLAWSGFGIRYVAPGAA